jgi:hypothetical protein
MARTFGAEATADEVLEGVDLAHANDLWRKTEGVVGERFPL